MSAYIGVVIILAAGLALGFLAGWSLRGGAGRNALPYPLPAGRARQEAVVSETVITGASAVFIDGPCPFLTCPETGPHGHDICPDCRAVKFGNLFCATCRSHWPGGDPVTDTRPQTTDNAGETP